MKKYIRLGFKICLWILMAGFLVSYFYKDMVYSRQYHMEEQEVLSTYRKKHTSTGVIKTEAYLLEGNMLRFCGNDAICQFSVPQTATLQISSAYHSGEGKLLFENEKGEITQIIPISQEQTEVVLDSDTYHVFLVGRWFRGKFVLQSKDNNIYFLTA